MRIHETPRPLVPHRLNVDFTPAVDRAWLGGRRVETHFVNALGILFPPGERFFARAARAALPQVKSPDLRAQVTGFIAQEVHHAFQHERCFAVLRAQGYQPERLSAWIERYVVAPVENVTPDKWHLAVTAALEHFTATVAEFVFEKGLFDAAELPMRELYLWHAAEEIEHKCVAFDLLQEVDERYRLRLVGMGIALPTFMLSWWGLTLAMVLQDRPRDLRTAAVELAGAVRNGRLALPEILRAAVSYCRPRFNPASRDTSAYARDYFARPPAASAH